MKTVLQVLSVHDIEKFSLINFMILVQQERTIQNTFIKSFILAIYLIGKNGKGKEKKYDRSLLTSKGV